MTRAYPFMMVISEDLWHSHLLPSVWQRSCHYLFLRFRPVATGDRTAISRMRVVHCIHWLNIINCITCIPFKDALKPEIEIVIMFKGAQIWVYQTYNLVFNKIICIKALLVCWLVLISLTPQSRIFHSCGNAIFARTRGRFLPGAYLVFLVWRYIKVYKERERQRERDRETERGERERQREGREMEKR